MQELDFVELIETNPITKFSGNYNNKILNKIQSNFTDFEQHLFISSFYCYLNYDKTKDFVVDLDNIWKWLGFSSKQNAIKLLERFFNVDKDYNISLNLVNKKENEQHGGQNIKKIMMNVRCFKSLCLKAQTKKASQIHEYYIKLEEMIQEVVAEENDELKLQLKLKDDELIQKDTEIIQNNIQFNINLCRNREKTLIQSYNKKSVIYLAHISGDDYKFGITNNIERRVHDHKADFGPSFILLLAFETPFYSKIENKVKTELRDKIYAKIFNEQRRVELIKINESFTQEMFYNTIQIYHKHFVDTITIETLSAEIVDKDIEIVEKDREILELKNSIIELSKTQNNNNNNNGIITIPEIIPQVLPQNKDIMDKKAQQKLKKAIRDKAYREKNKELIKIKSALHYQAKKNK
jgi:predicted GIY-YIG superfamily endonuclease